MAVATPGCSSRGVPQGDREEVPFDDWLHRHLVSAYGMERETWALEQVQRVVRKLNRARRRKPTFEVEILALREPTAFTAPGKYLYITRRLLERMPGDDAVAFVLAHEAAHHDLGHLEQFSGWAKKIPRIAGSSVVAALFRAVERRIYSHENELAADRRGIELCLKAKFEGAQCLSALDVMKQFSLDYGDLDGVYGVEDAELAEDPAEWLLFKARAAIQKRSHPAIEDRRALLKEFLASKATGKRRR